MSKWPYLDPYGQPPEPTNVAAIGTYPRGIPPHLRLIHTAVRQTLSVAIARELGSVAVVGVASAGDNPLNTVASFA